MSLSFLFLLAFSFQSNANDMVIEIGRQDQVYLNKNCQSNQSCGLRSFHLRTVTEQYNFKGHSVIPHSYPDNTVPSLGTYAVFGFTVSQPAKLMEYVVVQYIKGGAYSTLWSTQEKKPTAREYLGQPNVPFHHSKWVVDSLDLNPRYGSVYFAFNAPLSKNNLPELDVVTQLPLVIEVKPRVQSALVYDIPSAAFVGQFGLQETTMEFKTCIYKAKDVPSVVKVAEDFYPNPIKCFQWKNAYGFDRKQGLLLPPKNH